MSHGIYSLGKNEWIRGTCGLKKTAVKQAIRSLERKGVLICRRSLPGESRYNPQQGNAPTEYEINWGTLHALFRTCEKAPLGRKPTKPLGHRATEPLGRGATHNNRESSSKRTVYKEEENPSPHMWSVVEGAPQAAVIPTAGGPAKSTDEPPPATPEQAKQELAQLVGDRGIALTVADWQAISEELELRGIALPAFVAHIRPHLRNPKTHNPIGLIKSHIRRYNALQRKVAPMPLHPDEALRHIKETCAICKQEKGKGSLIVNNLPVACGCATASFRQMIEKLCAQIQERRRKGSESDQDP